MIRDDEPGRGSDQRWRGNAVYEAKGAKSSPMTDQFVFARDSAIKRRLREALTSAGYTLEEVALGTGESYRNVRNWISGPTRVPAHFVARFIAVVSVSGTWVLTGEGSRESAHNDLDGLVEEVVRAAGTVRHARRRPVRDRGARLRKALSVLQEE